MVLARWQATIQDEEGNVLPGASVEVRRESTGAPLAVLYSDRDGLTLKGNPFDADLDGFAAFHVAGGAFRITATLGDETRTWRYVAVGLAAERDTVDPGLPLLFDDGVNDADPGSGAFRFNNSTPGLATQMFVSDFDADGLAIAAWLATFDDAGDASDRGTFILQGAGGSSKIVARVTGSITDGGSYAKIPIEIITATDADTFTVDARYGALFVSSGVDGTNGTGTVNGPLNQSPGISPGDLAIFADATGQNIDAAGVNIHTVATGKETVWMPAAAMVRQTTNPPAALVTTELATNDIMLSYLAFDATTQENAQFSFPAPKGMDEGAGVSFRVRWSHGAAVTNFGTAWQLQALGIGDNEAMDAAMGTGIIVTDTGGTTDRQYTSPESDRVTIAGASEGDLCFFRISRIPGNAADNLSVDARLIGVEVFLYTNANTDD